MSREFLAIIIVWIMLFINLPLIVLYLRGNWPLRTIVICLVSLPVVWYLSYALLHELAHVAGTYLVGGSVVDSRLIPRFWIGEVGIAWIKSEGLTQTWQQLASTGSPYVLNIICLIVGITAIQRKLSSNPFVVGLVFMLLCLRPAFDFFSELTGFLLGSRGDFNAIEEATGAGPTWSFILISIALSLTSIVVVLRRFAGFPGTAAVEPEA
jgi:hypothetical protein